MRLLRVEDPATGRALELHPRLNVVHGLTGAVRERLVTSVAAIPGGTAPSDGGLVEVGGIRFGLTVDTLELLELRHDVDPVVRADDLPGAEERLVRWGSGAAHPEEVTSPAPGSGRPAPGDEVIEAVRARLAGAEGERAERSAELADARRVLQETVAERSRVLGEAEVTRTRLDPFALAGLKVARDELAAAEYRSRTRGSDGAGERALFEARLGVLAAEAEPLRREIERLRALDPGPVREVLEQIRQARRSVSAPSPEAQQLLGEWRRLVERRMATATRRAGSRAHLAEATARRDKAHAELLEAQQSLRPPRLDPLLVGELEAVHDELFELDVPRSRLGGGRARRRVEELRARESELLDRLGFDTWSSYVMGVGRQGMDLQRAHRLQVAQAAYEFAEEELARAAMSPVTDDSDARELDELEVVLRARITEVLGAAPGADPTGALAAVRVEVPAVSGVDLEALGGRLRRALETTGAELSDPGLGVAELESLAAGWLDAMEALPERLAVAEADLATVEREMAATGERLEGRAASGGMAATSAEHDLADLGAARERVVEAEQRARAHEAAANRIGVLVADDARLAGTEAELRGRVEALSVRLEAAEDAVGAAAEELRRASEAARSRAAASARLDPEPFRLSAGAGFDEVGRGRREEIDGEAVEWYLLARLARQRSLGLAGSVPLIVDDALSAWPFDEVARVFDRLERMGEMVQIVYLTDDPAVLRWARKLGGERAWVLDGAGLQH